MKKELVCYPAILDDSKNRKGIYSVTFPDVPEAITYGNGEAEAVYNAGQSLGLALYDYSKLPKPHSLDEVRSKNADKIITLIAIDLNYEKKQIKEIIVKRTVKLPAELIYKAELQYIDISKVLKKALSKQLK